MLKSCIKRLKMARTHKHVVESVVPAFWKCEEIHIVIQATLSTKFTGVSVQNNLVSDLLFQGLKLKITQK